MKEFEATVHAVDSRIVNVTTAKDQFQRLAQLSRIEIQVVGEVPMTEIRQLVYKRVKVIVLDEVDG